MHPPADATDTKAGEDSSDDERRHSDTSGLRCDANAEEHQEENDAKAAAQEVANGSAEQSAKERAIA